ncbi:histidine kinase [Gorillibacterium sp. CAU 1737]|uniref:sensor histidine kinase n=1 Tax=Gorillibacterium sp. CAU 1737 TaxID=3140362 RepID=UPI003260A1A5
MNAELAESHLKLQQAHEELERASVQSLRYAVLEERSRIARDIHDSIGHRLISVIVQLQALPYALKNEQGAQSEAIVKSVLDVARGCLQEVRTVVHNLGADETGAGTVSLRSLMQHIAVPSHMDIHLEMGEQAEQEDWPLAVAVVLYRSLQEALTNTIRHANAQRIDIAVVQSEQAVELHYQDDGQLMPGSHWQEGFGLSSIRKRCQDAGGHCTIEARVPHGMAIDIWLPLAAGEEH